MIPKEHILGGASDITPALFASPTFLLVVGALLGALLAFGAAGSVKRITPDDPFGGLVQAAALNFLIMLAAFGSLLAVYVFARGAMLHFGAALVFCFLVVSVVRFLGTARAQNAH